MTTPTPEGAIERLTTMAQRLEWGGVGQNALMPSAGDLSDAKAIRAILAKIARLEVALEGAENDLLTARMHISVALDYQNDEAAQLFLTASRSRQFQRAALQTTPKESI